jgi:DnaK suppressor protein
MGILDFIIKKKRERKSMKKKIEKKKSAARKEKKQLKKKSTRTKVVVTKQHSGRLKIKEPKHQAEWSLKEAKDALIKLKEEIFKTVNLRTTDEDALQKEELFDEVDHTIEERQKELSLMLNEREKAKLNEIEDALQRIENKTYGICEECGEDISPERLKYLPYVRLCVDCQDNLEKMEKEAGGSQSEAAKVGIPPGFSNVNENEEI